MTPKKSMSRFQWIVFFIFSTILAVQLMNVRHQMSSFDFIALLAGCELIILGVVASFTK